MKVWMKVFYLIFFSRVVGSIYFDIPIEYSQYILSFRVCISHRLYSIGFWTAEDREIFFFLSTRGSILLSLVGRGGWFRGRAGRNPESEERQCGQEVRHLGRSLPEVSHAKCCRVCRAGEEVRCVLWRVMAGRAGVGLWDADPILVGVERETVAWSELGKGGALLAREGGLLVGDVRGLEAEDTVGRAICNCGFHMLRVQHHPGLLSVLNCSVFRRPGDQTHRSLKARLDGAEPSPLSVSVSVSAFCLSPHKTVFAWFKHQKTTQGSSITCHARYIFVSIP